MAKILIVEDDLDLQSHLRNLLAANHRVEMCKDGLDALSCLTSSDYDLLILDWNLPQMSGLQVCAKYRAGGGTAPVLFLTGRGELIDKECGFEAGADDYLTKPFDLRELELRVTALLRRHKGIGEGILRFADLELDTKRRVVTQSGKAVTLSPREIELLEFLMRHPNENFTADMLVRSVWHIDSEATDQTARSYIRRLRDRLDKENQPSYIVNRHAHGYGLNRELSSRLTS